MRNWFYRFWRFVVDLWRTSEAFRLSAFLSAIFTTSAVAMSPRAALWTIAWTMLVWIGVLLLAFRLEPRETGGDGR